MLLTLMQLRSHYLRNMAVLFVSVPRPKAISETALLPTRNSWPRIFRWRLVRIAILASILLKNCAGRNILRACATNGGVYWLLMNWRPLALYSYLMAHNVPLSLLPYI